MSKGKVIVDVEDVGGSFARLMREAPKMARAELRDSIKKVTFMLSRRMTAMAPPDSASAPHIRDDIEAASRGLVGRAGILDGDAPAMFGPSATTQGHVAVYNEYAPNQQPFMRPAAEAVTKDFVREIRDALQRVERSLGSGTGI